jgi:hypothetical protein
MKQYIPLKRFEYSVPCSGICAKRMGSWVSDPFETHLPLLKVKIDFEKRDLYLEGKGLIERGSVQKPEADLSASDNERISVKATISSGFSINLSDFANDELVFSLEGSLDDGKTINSCSGLMVLGNTISRNGQEGNEWRLTVYVYDDCDDEREIKLRLMMYSLSENAPIN